MTLTQMKNLKPGDTILDAICLKGKTTKAFVVEVCKDGVKVCGIGEDKLHYGNPLNNEGTEVLPWSDAYGLDLLDIERINEPGYLSR